MTEDDLPVSPVMGHISAHMGTLHRLNSPRLSDHHAYRLFVRRGHTAAPALAWSPPPTLRALASALCRATSMTNPEPKDPNDQAAIW